MQRLDQEYVGSLKRNQVLALDIAEHTGVFGTYFQGTVYFPANDSKDAKKYGSELNIPVVFFNVRSIKKWATGDGNADKKKMIEYCEKRWHYICQDDNEADACHIYFYFLKRYNL